MHPNKVFRKTPESRNIEFARKRSFGSLTINAENVPLISHIPFQLSEDGSYLEAHLVGSNPIVQLIKNPVQAIMAVSGGDAYISPDWYGVDNQVPTWNYIAIHIRGQVQQLEHKELHGILERLSANMEGRITTKKPWKIDKVDTDIYRKMQKYIVPIAMRVEEIQGTWKLSQNKSFEAREGAMRGVIEAKIGAETDGIAKWMNLTQDE